MLHTLKDFVLRVNELEFVSDAYYLIEEECSESLIDSIYALADADSAEPFRNAMHKLGFTNY